MTNFKKSVTRSKRFNTKAYRVLNDQLYLIFIKIIKGIGRKGVIGGTVMVLNRKVGHSWSLIPSYPL